MAEVVATDAQARAIADDGMFVGGFSTDGGTHAFLYDDLWGERSLADVLASQGTDVSDWEFRSITSITYNPEDDAYTITGTGWTSAGPGPAEHGFIVEGVLVPEPATGLLLAAGIAMLRRRRCNRQG